MTEPNRVLPLDVMPDALDLPFWEGAARHVFLVHRCAICGRSYWPASCCVDHGAEAMEWTEASGLGVVHTYTVYRHAFDPAWADRIPYVLAVVRLDEGPFFHSDIRQCDIDEVTIGMRVRVIFEDLAGGTIPHFIPDVATP